MANQSQPIKSFKDLEQAGDLYEIDNILNWRIGGYL